MSRQVAGHSDAGMTLIEILVATVILFFAITAVFGLVATSTSMGLQSKQSVVSVNRLQSYIESVRRLPYDQVGVQGGSVAGTLTVETVIDEGGYITTITPTVTWVDDPNISGNTDYKLLRVVAVTAPANGGRAYSHTIETHIRESDANRPADAAPPEIEFASGSPDSMEIIGESHWVYANAWTPMENGLLSHLRYYCDGGSTWDPDTNRWIAVGARELRDSSGNPAEWTLAVKSVTGQGFYWNTKQFDEEGRPYSPDGIRVLKIETWDNIGQQAYRIRQVIVDNYAPSKPGTPTADPVEATKTRVSWTPAMDGTDPAPTYRVYLKQHTSNGDLSSWVASEHYPVQSSSWDQPSTAFSRYIAQVQAYSPGGLSDSGSVSGLSAPYISRSALSGTWKNTYSGNGGNKTCDTSVSLTLDQPTFTYWSISSTLYRSTSPDMADKVALVTGSGFTHTDTFSTLVGSKGSPTPYYYQAKSTIQPKGYPKDTSNPPDVVWSNVLGPNGTADTGTMPVAGW